MDQLAKAIEAATGAGSSELGPRQDQSGAACRGGTRRRLSRTGKPGGVRRCRRRGDRPAGGRQDRCDDARHHRSLCRGCWRRPPRRRPTWRCAPPRRSPQLRRASAPTPVHLNLTKRIPVAAGLGGGSADAAATLRLLDRIWDLELTPKQLAEIGVTLGADVPMCLRSRPLVARGIGEEVTPVARHPGPAGGARPSRHQSVPTGAVFAGLGTEQRSPLPPCRRSSSRRSNWSSG